MTPLTDRTVAIIGASRGLGRGAAEAFADSGATVLALARDPARPATDAEGSFRLTSAGLTKLTGTPCR